MVQQPNWQEFGSHPLGWPLGGALAELLPETGLPSVDEIDARLASRALVRFHQAKKPGRRKPPESRALGPSYDEMITEHGIVPTRPSNLHDCMNALVWATFPHAKRALHRRQAGLVRQQLGPRDAEGDTLAMLDEGGVLLVCGEELERRVYKATQRRDEAALAELVVAGRLTGVVFGHALFEHLARGANSQVHGLAVLVVAAAPSLAQVDQSLALQIADPCQFRQRSDYGSVLLCPSVLGDRALLGATRRPAVLE